MPNRIVKESIRTSKTVNSMTDFQFRFWMYLITYVDDYGRGSADPELIKGFVFPRRKGITEDTIKKTLAELATIGSIHLYDVEGESYFCFPNWSDHQRVQTKKSKFPEPVENNNPPSSTVSHRESPPESNPIQSESESELESESNPKGAAFTNRELQEALDGFIKMRKTIKKPLTDRALEMVITKLDKLSEGVNAKDRYKLECLNQSIFNNWAGVFEVKDFTDDPADTSQLEGLDEAYRSYLEKHREEPFSERLTMSEFYEEWVNGHA